MLSFTMASVLLKQMATCFDIPQRIRKEHPGGCPKPASAALLLDVRVRAAVSTRQEVCDGFTQLCTSGQGVFLSRIKNGDVHMGRQGKVTLCSVFWGCFSTSLQQDLPLAAARGKGGTAEQ